MNTQIVNFEAERKLREDERTLRRVDEALEYLSEVREPSLGHCEYTCECIEVLIGSGLFLEDELSRFVEMHGLYSKLATQCARAEGVPILHLDGTLEINGKLVTEDDIIE
jgi:hypothetical protein